MKIEVKSSEVESRTQQGKKGPWTSRTQRAWLHNGKAYPTEVQIRLDDDQAGFPPGEYALSDQCFWVGDYGRLQVDLRHMQPVKSAASRVV